MGGINMSNIAPDQSPKACIVQTARDVVANPHPDHTPCQRLYAWYVLMEERDKRADAPDTNQTQNRRHRGAP